MIAEKTYEEPQLLAMLAEDSEYAFQVLFNKYKDQLYKVAVLYVRSSAIAEDILQDIFTKVWQHRKTLGEIVSFERWLYTVGKHLILNYNKRLVAEWKVHKNYSLLQDNVIDDTDHKIRSNKVEALLQQAILQLSPQQQLIYKMAKEQHLSYRQIADNLSISPLTVKTHLARALYFIRSFLKNNGAALIIIIGISTIYIIFKPAVLHLSLSFVFYI